MSIVLGLFVAALCGFRAFHLWADGPIDLLAWAQTWAWTAAATAAVVLALI